jgi:tRNA-dihydrouridine synthase
VASASLGVNFPVIGSGDILSTESLNAIFQPLLAHKVQKVMVGRGALRNPWIFSELRSQQAVHISFEALHLALCTYAMLNLMYHENLPQLIELSEGIFANHYAHTSEEAWQVLLNALMKTLGRENEPITAIELPRQTLGRVKLLWGSLRSSLPTSFFNPQILRAKTLSDFLMGLAVANSEHRQQNGDERDLVLKHNPMLDWIYSTNKKPENLTSMC